MIPWRDRPFHHFGLNVRTSRITRAVILLSLSNLLGACASNNPKLEHEFAAINARLEAMDDRMADLEHQQAAHYENLSRQQQTAFAALMETTIAEVDRLLRERPPQPIVIGNIYPEQPEQKSAQAEQPSSRPAARRPQKLDDKQVVGSVETVHLSPPGITLTARIDTGAEVSSLDAREVTEFKRDGNTWVRFRIMNAEGEPSEEIERRVVRHVRILQSSNEDSERRPVVRLRVAIGAHAQVAEFTLTDREHLTYPVLIGRNVLKDVMVVDVSRSHIAPPPKPEANETDKVSGR